MRVRPLLLLLPVALAATLTVVAPAAPARKSCGSPGYAYAGLQARSKGFGVSATLSATAGALVEYGHVAGWIGVGAPGEGPQGADEWLQVGLNTIAGSTGALYYEVAQPWGIRYVGLASGVPVGRRYHVAVVETAGRRDVWRVWVDGKPASRPIWLPASHGRLTPMAMAESWDGDRAACNRYEYRFAGVRLAVRPGGSWARLRRRAADVLQDTGSRVVSARNGFVAVTAPAPPRLPRRLPPAERAPAAAASTQTAGQATAPAQSRHPGIDP
jgi:hypothetical protein